MDRFLNVYALPSFASPDDLAEGTVVVIDVLRASTTIIHALQAGAEEVIPCLETADALALADTLPRNRIVLGGERGGLPIEGFDLGNSPTDYTPFSVGGRIVVFTTTNGTRAMMQCRNARRVLIGAFCNASAVLEKLLSASQVHLVCAGSGDEISRDDVLFAGLLVDRLQRRSGLAWQCNAQAVVARENWLSAFALPAAMGAEPLAPEHLAAELQKSLAGQKLVSIGLEADIPAAAQIDQFPIVPELDLRTFRIR
jgi:2-phosphosulfolactate phosphatase